MLGQYESELRPLHSKLDVLSNEWSNIPLLPHAITIYQDIIKNPTNYWWEFEDRPGSKKKRTLSSPFDLDTVDFLYDLSEVQSTQQREENEDCLSVFFSLKPLRDLAAQDPSPEDPTPSLAIKRTPESIDGMLDHVSKAVTIVEFLGEGVPDPDNVLRNAMENVFVESMRSTYYPVKSVSAGDTTLIADLESKAYQGGGQDIEKMVSKVSTLLPNTLKRIEVVDIYLRDGVLRKKKRRRQ